MKAINDSDTQSMYTLVLFIFWLVPHGNFEKICLLSLLWRCSEEINVWYIWLVHINNSDKVEFYLQQLKQLWWNLQDSLVIARVVRNF